MLQFKHKKNEKNVQIVQREVRMKKLLYRPKDAWVGDLIPYYEMELFMVIICMIQESGTRSMQKKLPGIL